MEWRIFFPIFSSEQVHSLNSTTHGEFQLFVDELESSQFSLTTALFPKSIFSDLWTECRSDSYVIGSHYFGLKLRNQSKLELKILVSADSTVGVETWRKCSYGKTSIAANKENIMSRLVQGGYANTALHDHILNSPRLLVVSKTRKSAAVNDIFNEFCVLKIENQEAPHSNWVSICFEADSCAILQEYITTNKIVKEFIMHLIKASSILSDLVTKHPGLFIYQPIICGYPYWIKFVSNPTHDETLASILETFEFLKVACETPSK